MLTRHVRLPSRSSGDRSEALLVLAQTLPDGNGNGDGDGDGDVVLAVGDLTLDPVSREVHRGDDLITLRPEEFDQDDTPGGSVDAQDD